MSKFLNIFIRTLTAILVLAHLSEPVDETLVANATGCDVTKAAVDKIVSSSVFPFYDNFLLYRVAMTSFFGTKILLKDTHGIWQLTKANLDDAKEKMDDMKLADKIQNYLGVDLENASEDDLDKPMFGALVAYLLIQKAKYLSNGQGNQKRQKISAIPWRAQIHAQYFYWRKAAKILDDTLSKPFLEAAELLDKNEGDAGSDCLVCNQQPSDLLFVLDDSGSIDDLDWRLQVQYVETVLDHYQGSMDDSTTQAGLIIFGSTVEEQLDYTSDSSAIRRTLANFRRQKAGTDITKALMAAKSVMGSGGEGSRIDNPAVTKFMFLLTDGQNAGDEEGLLKVMQEIHQMPINVFALGMTDSANYRDMLAIASKPQYVRVYQDFDTFDEDVLDVMFSTCSATTVLEMDDDGKSSFTLDNMKVGVTRHMQISMTVDFAVSLNFKQEHLHLRTYFSFTQMFPSEADYDFQVDVEPNGNPVVVYDPDSDGYWKSRARRSSDDADNADQVVFGMSIETTGAEDCGANCTEDVDVELEAKPNEEEYWESELSDIDSGIVNLSDKQLSASASKEKIYIAALLLGVLVASKAYP